jgi:hypothetical protein
VSRRLQEIARRKALLVERCARQRDELGARFREIRHPLELGGLIFRLTRVLKSHPIAAAGISSLLASGYAGNALRLTGKGLALWRLVRPVWAWWQKHR